MFKCLLKEEPSLSNYREEITKINIYFKKIMKQTVQINESLLLTKCEEEKNFLLVFITVYFNFHNF